MRSANRIHAGLAAGLLLSGVGAAARAQAAAPAAAQSQADDRAFLARALGVNELEVRLGRLAAERGTTPEVKAQGQKMIQNHTALGQELATLARQAGAAGKAELSPDERAAYDRVAAQPASGFDAEFRRTVDDGHVKELAMYRDEVGRAVSPDLRALAERRVAALEKAMAGSQGAKGMAGASGAGGDQGSAR